MQVTPTQDNFTNAIVTQACLADRQPIIFVKVESCRRSAGVSATLRMGGTHASLTSGISPQELHVGLVAVRVKPLAIRLCCWRKFDNTRLLQIVAKLVHQADVINEDLAPMTMLSIHDADEDRVTFVF